MAVVRSQIDEAIKWVTSMAGQILSDDGGIS